MLSPLEAEALILDLVEPIKDVETINFNQCLHRVLAETISGRQDFPYWDNSAMDGYALRYEDVRDSTPSHPVTLEVIEEIPAGKAPQKALKPRQASRIFTGAMLPPGADTIVIQENTLAESGRVTILAAPARQGDCVRYRGEFYRAGTPLLKAGISLNPAEIAILATAQRPMVSVFSAPRAAIFSTGDELVSPEQVLQAGQIVDSNQYALAALVRSQGAIPLPLGIVPDRPETLREIVAQAIATANFVLSTGGVSVGDYDYVTQVLTELGAKIYLRNVAMKPGKPLTVAKFSNGCVYFGIPGNPVSALVTAWRFVQPALKKLSGLKENWQPNFILAKTRHLLKGAKQRESYLWGRVTFTAQGIEFALAGGSHSSGNLINLAQTNALAVVPTGRGEIQAEEEVQVMLIPQGLVL